MKNLEKLYTVINNCEYYNNHWTLEMNVYGYNLTIYLWENHSEQTKAIIAILNVEELKAELTIKDKHFENEKLLRVINIKAERA